MTTKAPGASLTDAKAELLFNALSGEAIEAECLKCKAVEWVIPLEGPLDELFLTNYFCDECDTAS